MPQRERRRKQKYVADHIGGSFALRPRRWSMFCEEQPIQLCLVPRRLSVTSCARRTRTDGGLSSVSGTDVNQEASRDIAVDASAVAGKAAQGRLPRAQESRKGGWSTTYRRSQIYVTQRRPDHRMQGAKRGANAGRR